MTHPATLTEPPAGAGRRGDLLPAPSPDKISQSVARACASDTATGAAAAAKAPISPLSGGPSTCGFSEHLLSQAERHERRMCHPSAAAWRIADTPRGCAPRDSWLEGNGPAQWATALDAIAGCSDRPALTSSALTADPRRADPGNLLAGAVLVLRRLSIMCNWPVALRGGGHIAGAA